ncbi:hypothetical protein SAMN02745194_02054 [Roseomonas rosea]|uniref:Uncharacterized protein n=1 Tax=Muricoccus roseus TaxID=198092 RepID=A0A1M6HM11_9PROT|nr:hypothetical protein SAMN02745194_02054 [Roseomonas rosea]
MSLQRWLSDTIARRFVSTILLAFGTTLLMNTLFVSFAGVWVRPSLLESGLLNSAATAVRIIEALPPEKRPAIAAVAGTAEYRLTWYPGETPLRVTERLRGNFDEALSILQPLLGSPSRTVIFFASDSPEMDEARFRFEPGRNAETYFMGIQLLDRSWLIFTVPEWTWGLNSGVRGALELCFAFASVLALAMVTARNLALPIERLAAAARRFRTDRRHRARDRILGVGGRPQQRVPPRRSAAHGARRHRWPGARDLLRRLLQDALPGPADRLRGPASCLLPPASCLLPPALVARAVAARTMADRFPPGVLEGPLAQLITGGDFAEHVRRMRSRYRAARDLLAASLMRASAGMLGVRVPDQGLHLVATLPRELPPDAAEKDTRRRRGGGATPLGNTDRARRAGRLRARPFRACPPGVEGGRRPSRPGCTCLASAAARLARPGSPGGCRQGRSHSTHLISTTRARRRGSRDRGRCCRSSNAMTLRWRPADAAASHSSPASSVSGGVSPCRTRIPGGRVGSHTIVAGGEVQSPSS